MMCVRLRVRVGVLLVWEMIDFLLIMVVVFVSIFGVRFILVRFSEFMKVIVFLIVFLVVVDGVFMVK